MGGFRTRCFVKSFFRVFFFERIQKLKHTFVARVHMVQAIPSNQRDRTKNAPPRPVWILRQVVWKATTEVGCALAKCEKPYTGTNPAFQNQNWKVTTVVCREYCGHVGGSSEPFIEAAGCNSTINDEFEVGAEAALCVSNGDLIDVRPLMS